MTISPCNLIFCVSMAIATTAFAADPPDQPGAPETVRVASTESVSVGSEAQKFAFMLVKSDAGKCYAVTPPGGEGMTAGDSYAVVAATGVSDFARAEMTKGHPDCKVVDVVARIAK